MSVGERPRARHLGPERRRPEVLDTALTMAVDQGVSAVTIAAIAERMGVTRPVVYACFADRVEVLSALLDREEQRLLAAVTDAMPRGRVTPNEATFIRGFQTLLSIVSKSPNAWRIVFDASPDPAVADRFGRGRATVIDQVTQLLRPALQAWGTTDAERKLPALVEHFVSASEAAVRTLLNGSWAPDELGELIGRAVFHALRNA